MIIKLAWRNIWRNRTRSLVIMTAIALGIVAALFLDAFFMGMMSSYVDSGINKVTSHIQIHAPGYLDDENIKTIIKSPGMTLNAIDTMSEVKGVSSRILVYGMISSSRTSQSILVKGIDIDRERMVSDLEPYIVEGQFLSPSSRNKIIVSSRTADKMKVGLGKKIVVTFQDMEGDITAGLFRIQGLYDTGNNGFDEFNAFVKKEDIIRTMFPSNPPEYDPDHEIAILLNDKSEVGRMQYLLSKTYPDLDIKTYKEISPELSLYESQMDTMSWIYFIIIMLALVFGIVNTMLMAVLDRYKELGVLMSVGMGKARVFGMVLMETWFLCLVAAPIGMLLGYLVISYFNARGIDLSGWSEMLEEYGMLVFVHPEVSSASFIRLTIILVLTASLAAVYPAWKAISLNPLDAIRKI